MSFSFTPDRNFPTSSRNAFSSFASDLLNVDVDAMGAGADGASTGAAWLEARNEAAANDFSRLDILADCLSFNVVRFAIMSF